MSQPANDGEGSDASEIRTDAQLQRAIEQVERLYESLNALRADLLPKNPRQFAIFVEGPLDEIRKLQAEIESYVMSMEEVSAA